VLILMWPTHSWTGERAVCTEAENSIRCRDY
jgi:hypothetical protein